MPIVDQYGKPIVTESLPRELGEFKQPIRGTYDAARDSDEFKNYWANADRYDADSANSREVRHTLISRSRYEIGNNGYSDGIASTATNDLVGVGPSLRMMTGSTGFNQLVELSWQLWTKAIQFRRKLWCQAHAKHSDGESIAVLRRNPGVKHPIPLDVCLYEAEQCQTPYLPYEKSGYIDGIQFDEFGNAISYDILRYHPGSSGYIRYDLVPEKVPVNRVLHWFKLRRPGQHRGVPECASTLNVGAASRRWREATVGAAETAAEFTAVLKTQLTPDVEIQSVAAMSTMDIAKRMMIALPQGYDLGQMRAEHPNTSYEMFNKAQINEQARPRSMPLNKAMCNSSDYNYASGQLDHVTYYSSLDVDREDCADLVLDPLFNVWFDLAILRFGWLGGNPEAIGAAARLHQWDWPKHRVADRKQEADSHRIRLTSGQTSMHRLWSDQGLDLEDEIPIMATTFGVDESVIRQRLFDIALPPVQGQQEPSEQPAAPKTDEAVAALFSKVTNRMNGNGAPVNGH